MASISDLAERILETGSPQYTEGNLLAEAESPFAHLVAHVHRTLGLDQVNPWVVRYTGYALMDLLADDERSPDEIWPGGNLEDEEELLQWLAGYPLAVATIQQAWREFGLTGDVMKDVAMGLELMSKTIFDVVYRYLEGLLTAEAS